MIPPMKDGVVKLYLADTSQPKDRYGRYPEKLQTIKGNVKFSTKVMRKADGTEVSTDLEVLVPPIPLEEGKSIEVKDHFDVWHKVTIESVKDIENFGGNRLLYRRVLCAK